MKKENHLTYSLVTALISGILILMSDTQIMTWQILLCVFTSFFGMYTVLILHDIHRLLEEKQKRIPNPFEDNPGTL